MSQKCISKIQRVTLQQAYDYIRNGEWGLIDLDAWVYEQIVIADSNEQKNSTCASRKCCCTKE